MNIFTRFNFYNNLNRVFALGFVVLLMAQIIFWSRTENINPDVGIVPNVPTMKAAKAAAFGDEQFYFRVKSLEIENAGDSFGRFTSFKRYDYSKLYGWFSLLSSIDKESNYPPTLATNYYAATPNKSDTKYIVQYLDEFASEDVTKHWWWIYRAFHIANNTLGDKKLALNLALKLSNSNSEDVPIWAKQLPAFIYESTNDDCAAFLFIENLLTEYNKKDQSKIDHKEMEFMRYFIKKKIYELEQKNFSADKCKKKSKK